MQTCRLPVLACLAVGAGCAAFLKFLAAGLVGRLAARLAVWPAAQEARMDLRRLIWNLFDPRLEMVPTLTSEGSFVDFLLPRPKCSQNALEELRKPPHRTLEGDAYDEKS